MPTVQSLTLTWLSFDLSFTSLLSLNINILGVYFPSFLYLSAVNPTLISILISTQNHAK